MTAPMPKLTAKQERFCREYMIDGNATQAAIRAGYSKRSAGQVGGANMNKHEIAAKLAELRGEVAERHDITLDLLTSMAMEAHNDAKADADHAARIRAIAQLSKMHGFDADTRKNERSPLEGMSLDDLAALRGAVAADTEAESGTRH